MNTKIDMFRYDQKRRLDLFVTGDPNPKNELKIFSEKEQIKRYSKALAFAKKEIEDNKEEPLNSIQSQILLMCINQQILNMFRPSVVRKIHKKADKIKPP